MNRRAYFLTGAILILGIALVLPVAQKRVLSYGVDTHAAHKPIYGEKTISQTITTEHQTTGIGAIIVNLQKPKEFADSHVEIINDATGATLISQSIPASSIKDDSFAYTSFPDRPIPAQTDIRIVFSAPNATNKNLLGVRFNPKDGALALSITEKVPAWKFIQTIASQKGNTLPYVLTAVALSLLGGLAALLTSYNKKGWWIILGLFIGTSFILRVIVIPQFGGVSGGDAYNYLSISDAILEGKNPFANTKRLPGYPLILAPFYGSGLFDDQQVMRYVQSLASIGGIVLIVIIARSLHLSWPVAFLTGIIIASQKDYFATSLRPEPYSIFTFLLLLSVFLFSRSHEKRILWQLPLFGITLGYSAMTRQEGFVLAALLGACSLVYEGYRIYKERNRKTTIDSIKTLVAMYAPALVLVFPFFIHNFYTYGHPLYTEYLEGDRLQIVDSYFAFQDAIGATWGIIGSMWKTSWDELVRLPFMTPLFFIPTLLLWGWYGAFTYTKHKAPSWINPVITSVAWVALLAISLFAKPLFVSTISAVTASLLFASIPIFIMRTKMRGVVILLVAISQILIATWFHPFPKHYQQSYPFIALVLATGLLSWLQSKKKLPIATSLALTSLPFLLVALFLSQKMNAEIDNYNEEVALDSVSYRAARAARNLPGPIGFDQAYLPARLYFDPEAKYFPDEDNPTQQMEQEWLEKTPLKTLVITNGNNVFKTPAKNWELLQTFKAAGEDEKIFESAIYSIPE